MHGVDHTGYGNLSDWPDMDIYDCSVNYCYHCFNGSRKRNGGKKT